MYLHLFLFIYYYIWQSVRCILKCISTFSSPQSTKAKPSKVQNHSHMNYIANYPPFHYRSSINTLTSSVFIFPPLSLYSSQLSSTLSPHLQALYTAPEYPLVKHFRHLIPLFVRLFVPPLWRRPRLCNAE